MKPFMTEDFLLDSKTAQKLYHDFAENKPIIDYHCHIPPAEIADDRKFTNLFDIWLRGDHYKWRAMRTAGVDERFCTGDACDWEKFAKWAETVPKTLRNPLYHWTHLELKNPFGITGKLLSPSTAKEIWDECNKKLVTPAFSCRGLISKARVEVICTTDDPIDSLEHHKKLAADKSFATKVFPAFRPDKGMAVENPADFNSWVDKLIIASGKNITDFSSYLAAIKQRHDFFHENGCRLSDHGIEEPYAEDYTDDEVAGIFKKIRAGSALTSLEIQKFKSAMMFHFGVMDAESNWTQQLHFGALRNVNSRRYRELGPDTGFDTIGDFTMAKPLSKFLDKLDTIGKLPKTIIYNLNPRDNELISTMLGCFQNAGFSGKIQFGSGWWFLDQKDGMEKQINSLSSLGLLSQFVGMLTDSRSFLSYSRHEYFRRLLCNILGNDMEKGLVPDDLIMVGKMVEDICHNNARKYFGFAI
ncbi:MAG: glucuronate isomerase [Spirochaetaceae bacterium]|nr:MAG: glucuronate isomerase [Spirochaetaceae bacterium]